MVQAPKKLVSKENFTQWTKAGYFLLGFQPTPRASPRCFAATFQYIITIKQHKNIVIRQSINDVIMS